MIVYFTGTGNSRYCAFQIAHSLNDEVIDCFSYLQSGCSAQLHSEQPWIFVAPTYGWQLPRIFEEFLRRSHFSGSHDAWFVMTCGSEIGYPEPRIRTLCQALGLRCQGVFPVVMPENYIALFSAPEEAEARQIITAARPALERAISDITSGTPFPPQQPSLLDRLKSGPIHWLFYRFYIKASPFYAADSCIGCGKCVRDCPFCNIQLVDGSPVWGNQCTHCMACICGCPVQAIEYGKISRGKPRYQCPE